MSLMIKFKFFQGKIGIFTKICVFKIEGLILNLTKFRRCQLN